jgi:hypothetical protein
MIMTVFTPSGLIKIASAYKPITITKKTLYLNGEPYQINFDRLKVDATINYLSSNNSIAKVSKDGLVTPVSIGKAIITVKIKQDNKNYTSNIEICVNYPYISIINAVSELEVGDRYNYLVKSIGLLNPDIIWSVSDETLGCINSDTGKFTAKFTGSIIITAKDRKSGKCSKILVTIKDKQDTAFAINNRINDAWCNTSYQFLAEGTRVDEAGVTWSVSDSELASIDDAGVFVSKKVGTVTVTATDTISQEDSSCTVSIKDIEVSPEDLFEVSHGYITGLKNSSQEEIKIPEMINGETIIGISYDAFANQSQLKVLIFPSSIEEIQWGVFSSLPNLESVVFVEGTTGVRLGEYAFFRCISLKEFITPNQCEMIFCDYAIAYNENLSRFIIPKGTLGIGTCAFAGLVGISEFTIAETVTGIGEAVFMDCKDISVTIPKSVTNINEYAFYKCKNITIITPEESNAEALAKRNYITYMNY